jgi:hypothetical protein
MSIAEQSVDCPENGIDWKKVGTAVAIDAGLTLATLGINKVYQASKATRLGIRFFDGMSNPTKVVAGRYKWPNNFIEVSKQGVRWFAQKYATSWRHQLYNTVYHEAFHRGFAPIKNVISKIAKQTLSPQNYGKLGEWIHRAEEAAAKAYGNIQGYYQSWKRK